MAAEIRCPTDVPQLLEVEDKRPCMTLEHSENTGANLPPSTEPLSSSNADRDVVLQFSTAAADAGTSDDVTTFCYSEAAMSTASDGVKSSDEAAGSQSDCDNDSRGSHTASRRADSQTSDVIQQVGDAVTSPLMYSDVDSTNELHDVDDCAPCSVTRPNDNRVSVNEGETDKCEGLPGKSSELSDKYSHGEATICHFSQTKRADDAGLSHRSGECLNAVNQQDDVAADVVSMETVSQFTKPGCSDNGSDAVVRNCPVSEDNSVDKSFEYEKNCVVITVSMNDDEDDQTKKLQDGVTSGNTGQSHPHDDEEKHMSKNTSPLHHNADDDERLPADNTFRDCLLLSCEEHRIAYKPGVDGAEHFQQIPCTANVLDDFIIPQHMTDQPYTQGLQPVTSQSSKDIPDVSVTDSKSPPLDIDPESDVSTESGHYSADDSTKLSSSTCEKNACLEADTYPVLSEKRDKVYCVLDSSAVLPYSAGERKYQDVRPDAQTDKEMEQLTGIDIMASVCECLVNANAEGDSSLIEAGEVYGSNRNGQFGHCAEMVEENCEGEQCALDTVALNDTASAAEQQDTCHCEVLSCHDNSNSCVPVSRVFEEDDDDDDDDGASQTNKEYQYADDKNSEDVAQTSPDDDDDVDDDAAADAVVVLAAAAAATSAAVAVAAAAADDDDDDDYDSDETSASRDLSSEPYEFSIESSETETNNSSDSYYDSDEQSDKDDKKTDDSDDSDFEGSLCSDDVMAFDEARESDRTTESQDDQNEEQYVPQQDTSEDRLRNMHATVNSTSSCTERINRTEMEMPVQKVGKESFAMVPDTDDNECCKLLKEVLTECVGQTADQSETFTFGRNCVNLGLSEGCSSEFWWRGGVIRDDDLVVDNKYELQVPCDDDSDDDDDDDVDDVEVIDCGEFVNPSLDKTAHIETSSTDVNITSETACIPADVAGPPLYSSQTGQVDHHDSQPYQFPLKQEMFGIEDDDLCDLSRGQTEDEIFYTDCEEQQDGKHDQEHIEPETTEDTVVPTTVDADFTRKRFSSCDLRDKSHRQTFYTDYEEPSECACLDARSAIVPTAVERELISGGVSVVAQTECEVDTVDSHTVVNDDDDDDSDSDEVHVTAAAAAAAVSYVYVAVPLATNTDNISTGHGVVLNTHPSSSSEHIAKSDNAESTSDSLLVRQLQIHVVSPSETTDAGDAWSNVSTSMDQPTRCDQSTRCLQAADQVKLSDAFQNETPARSTGSSPCRSGKPDHGEMYSEDRGYKHASRDQQVLDDSKAQPGYHSNHNADKPTAVTVTSVASGITNPLDYCNSLSVSGGQSSTDMMMMMMMMRSRDAGDQTVDETVDNTSPDEQLLYAACQPPPGTSCCCCCSCCTVNYEEHYVRHPAASTLYKCWSKCSFKILGGVFCQRQGESL